MNKTFIYKDIEVDLVYTDKFKSIIIDTIFEGEFAKETISNKCLLHLVLENSNKYQKTKEDVVNKAFDLYNAVVDVNVLVNHQVISTIFTLDIIDYKLINQPEKINEALDYYRNFIFEPDIIDEKFRDDIFKEKQKAIIDAINRRYNNKSRYATRKMLEQMCKGELTAIPVTGTIEDIEKITPKSLYIDYLNMLKENMRIVITGKVSEDEAKAIVDGVLGNYQYHKENNLKKLSPYSNKFYNVREVKHISEEQKINQSILIMGFRLNTELTSSLSKPAQIFNIMFGGINSSNLFQKIREEQSLAYSIYSDCFLTNQIMTVNAGVKCEDLEIVEKLVLEELDKYKQGIIDTELFEQAKTFAISDVERLEDSNYSMSNYYYKQRLLGTNITQEKLRDLFDKVTIEEVIEVANLIELDTVYYLKGVNKDENR